MDLTDSQLAFLKERHLGTLTTIRSDGSPHVVAIAFSYDADDEVVRIITNDGSQKVRNVEATGLAAVSQVDGRRWLTIEGTARVKRDGKSVAEAERAFELRYRPASENPARVAIEIDAIRHLGSL